MFDVPGAKRIKRSELFQADDSLAGSEVDSRSASPAGSKYNGNDEVVTVPNYGFDYEFISPGGEVGNEAGPPKILAGPTDAENGDEDQEQEYQFRLFTSATAPRPTARTSQLQSPTSIRPTIRLSRTPSPSGLGLGLGTSRDLEQAHFVRPNRPETYYFTSALPQKTIQGLKSQYAQVAVSTSDILSRAKLARWPGSSLPWRVIHVELAKPPASADHNDVRSRANPTPEAHGGSSSRAKSKPSKKRRIILRRRLAKRTELNAQAVDAEMAEREKRARRNRDKKIKRREREKRKKLLDGEPQADHGLLHNHREGGSQGEKPLDVKEDVSMTTVQVGQSPAAIAPDTLRQVSDGPGPIVRRRAAPTSARPPSVVTPAKPG